MLSGAYFVFGASLGQGLKPVDQRIIHLDNKQHSKSIGGDVHGPDGPVFGGAKCPRAEEHHEVD